MWAVHRAFVGWRLGAVASLSSRGFCPQVGYPVLTVSIELVGGLSLLLGYKARPGAIALIVFLIPATLIFHTDFSEQMQQIMFMKNLEILGGLLMVIQYGSGNIGLRPDR
ncbi:DoxX family protein [Oculatella sp. LEGE 06141]|uniref:DoxX family membrane protein n=1 Tax=Oculatella sp. LEGE 06141 TaxID=1828648 RepID=UPI00187E4757|nr:DoxX family protein [Oculatella sp. LEGE 06141]